MGEKTEKATPKKLRDARNKGQVAKSQDLPSAFTFIASIWIMVSMSRDMYDKMGAFLVGTFKAVDKINLESSLPGFYYEAAQVIFLASIPILVAVSIIGVIVNFLSVGPLFTMEVFKFDIKKFDPISNLKSKFKIKTLVELLKSIIKISVASYLIYDVMYNSIPVLIKTGVMPTAQALMVFHTFLMEVVLKVGLFFIAVAVADMVYQKKSFANEMKMEKFEVKQEYKNTEGDPLIKSKRRQLAQEIATGDGPMAGMRTAKAVVTNPTHLAIAICYETSVDAAPYIVGMGENILAERMIKLAYELNIPVVRNIKLAHKLWDEGEIYEFVPEESYEAIAEILRWIDSLQTEYAYDYDPD